MEGSTNFNRDVMAHTKSNEVGETSEDVVIRELARNDTRSVGQWMIAPHNPN